MHYIFIVAGVVIVCSLPSGEAHFDFVWHQVLDVHSKDERLQVVGQFLHHLLVFGRAWL